MKKYTCAKVQVEFTISYVLSNEEAQENGFNNFEDAINWLIQEEGLFSLVDNGYKIISILEDSFYRNE